MNFATIIGNVGREPEIRTLKNGASVANFSVATNETVNGEKYTHWHNVVAWRGHADAVRDLKAGDPVVIVGQVQTRKWEDQKGEARYTTELVVAGFTGAVARQMFSGTKEDVDQTPRSNKSPFKRYDQKREEQEGLGLNDSVPF